MAGGPGRARQARGRGGAKRGDQEQASRFALVPVENEYEFDTEDGKKTLAELFDGRSQLLAYNIMFGPDYTLGACPGCTMVGDELDGSLVHLNHRDVTLFALHRSWDECDHGKTAVHEEISTVASVADMSVGLETKRVEVTGDDLDDAAIKVAIEDAGYEARIASDPTMTSPSVNRAE